MRAKYREHVFGWSDVNEFEKLADLLEESVLLIMLMWVLGLIAFKMGVYRPMSGVSSSDRGTICLKCFSREAF
jgi:hypothetical protein